MCYGECVCVSTAMTGKDQWAKVRASKPPPGLQRTTSGRFAGVAMGLKAKITA